MKNTVSRYTGPFVLKLCCQSLITPHSAWIIFSFPLLWSWYLSLLRRVLCLRSSLKRLSWNLLQSSFRRKKSHLNSNVCFVSKLQKGYHFLISKEDEFSRLHIYFLSFKNIKKNSSGLKGMVAKYWPNWSCGILSLWAQWKLIQHHHR